MAITIVKPENLQDYVGKELEATDWFKVDQDRINKFADATEDHQFIHVDLKSYTYFWINNCTWLSFAFIGCRSW